MALWAQSVAWMQAQSLPSLQVLCCSQKSTSIHAAATTMQAAAPEATPLA